MRIYKNGVRKSIQHTATHCNTLQHTATHCNTLQEPEDEGTKPLVLTSQNSYLLHARLQEWRPQVPSSPHPPPRQPRPNIRYTWNSQKSSSVIYGLCAIAKGLTFEKFLYIYVYQRMASASPECSASVAATTWTKPMIHVKFSKVKHSNIWTMCNSQRADFWEVFV